MCLSSSNKEDVYLAQGVVLVAVSKNKSISAPLMVDVWMMTGVVLESPLKRTKCPYTRVINMFFFQTR